MGIPRRSPVRVKEGMWLIPRTGKLQEEEGIKLGGGVIKPSKG